MLELGHFLTFCLRLKGKILLLLFIVEMSKVSPSDEATRDENGTKCIFRITVNILTICQIAFGKAIFLCRGDSISRLIDFRLQSMKI